MGLVDGVEIVKGEVVQMITITKTPFDPLPDPQFQHFLSRDIGINHCIGDPMGEGLGEGGDAGCEGMKRGWGLVPSGIDFHHQSNSPNPNNNWNNCHHCELDNLGAGWGRG